MKNLIIFGVMISIFSSCSYKSLQPLTKKVVEEKVPLEQIPENLQIYSSGPIVLDYKEDTIVHKIVGGVLVNNYHQDTDPDYEVGDKEKGTLLPGGNLDKIEVRFGPESEKLPFVLKKTRYGYLYYLDIECDKRTANCTVLFKDKKHEVVQGKYTYILFEEKQKIEKTSDKQKASGVDVTNGAKAKSSKRSKKGGIVPE